MKQLSNEQIIERLKVIQNNIAASALKVNRTIDDIQIMAVTKTVSPKFVNVAIENGIHLIGENKVQEYLEKKDEYLIEKQRIHFIGHLQTNKVKYIIDSVSMIESVSSVKLAKEIDLRAKNINTKMEILLEINIANEPSKNGFLSEELKLAIEQIAQLQNVKIKGIMCIPPKENSDFYFEQMSLLFSDLKARKDHDISCLSMGMSDDYQKAILHGATIIRLGSAIFGERNIGG